MPRARVFGKRLRRASPRKRKRGKFSDLVRATRKQRLKKAALSDYNKKFNEWLAVCVGRAKMRGRPSLTKLQRELDKSSKRCRRVKC